jgi:hypothetical protein
MPAFIQSTFAAASGAIVSQYSDFMYEYMLRVNGISMTPLPEDNDPIKVMLGDVVNRIYRDVKSEIITNFRVKIEDAIVNVDFGSSSVERGTVYGTIEELP